LIDDLDLDGILRTRVYTGGLEASSKATVTHVAFADDTTLGVELGHRVGAIPNTILATDTCLGGMKDKAGNRVLLIGVYGAAAKAIGREAVMAPHRKVEPRCVGPRTTFDLANASPSDVRGVSILLIARHFAGAASDALRHVEVESVLLPWAKRTLGNKRRLLLNLCTGLV
jgi:hypothetical protein